MINDGYVIFSCFYFILQALRDEQADEEKVDEEKKSYMAMYGTSDVTAPTISGSVTKSVM